MKDKMERRIFAINEVRVEQGSDGPLLSGYAAVFGVLSVDLGVVREKIQRGAFTDSLSGDVRALWNPDSSVVMGRTTSGTLRLSEDSKGLKFEIDPPESATGMLESIERGDVDQMSFGFRAIADDWDNDDGQTIRTLIKAELYDVSPVAFPAYPATELQLRNEIYGYIPDIPESVRAHGSDIDEKRAQARLKRMNNKLDLFQIGVSR